MPMRTTLGISGSIRCSAIRFRIIITRYETNVPTAEPMALIAGIPHSTYTTPMRTTVPTIILMTGTYTLPTA